MVLQMGSIAFILYLHLLFESPHFSSILPCFLPFLVNQFFFFKSVVFHFT